MAYANKLISTIEKGDVALGGQTVLHSPKSVETCGNLGLDFVWADFEHIGPSPFDASVCENLVRAAELSGTELMIRIPSSNPSLVRKTLDASVQNILVPRIRTAQEVEDVIAASRFAYKGAVGRRGLASCRASQWGSRLDKNYTIREDNNVLVGVMIENKEAVDNLDQILSVENLGFVVIGQADLSLSLGYPLEFEHPAVESAIEKIMQKSIFHDVPFMRVVSDIDDIHEAIQNGAHMVRISGGEISAMRYQLLNMLNGLKEYR